MQRMKGQGTVPNGPKDQNYSSFQNFSNSMTSMAAAPPSEAYMSSFYMTSTPFQAFGVGDATWSNGGEHMQTYLGGYGGQVGFENQNTIDGIFSGGNYCAPGFNYGYGSGDYNTWSDVRNNAKYDEYYQRNIYPDGVKTLEQSVQGLTLSDPKVADQSKDSGRNSMSNGSISNEKLDSDNADNISNISQPKKGLSWASVASQPAKPQPNRRRDKTTLSSIVPGRHMDIGTWEGKNGGPKPVAPPPAPRPAWDAPRGGSRSSSNTYNSPPPPQNVPIPPAPVSPQLHLPQSTPPSVQQTSYQQAVHQASPPQQQQIPHQQVASGYQIPPQQASPQPVVAPPQVSPHLTTREEEPPAPASPSGSGNNPTLDDLQLRNEYNPKDLLLSCENSRFFVIKSYSEDDIHRSIKYEIWCSTEHGNKRLDTAFKERESKGPIYLFFSVNGSGHFCGIAQMISSVDYNSSSSVWAQDKWKGQFKVQWIYVKDVPNGQLRHIRLPNNENKPVTNSRDTQEVPFDSGKQVIKIIHGYRHKTSIFDDFIHYEKRQEESEYRRGHQVVTKDVEREHRNDHREHRDHHHFNREYQPRGGAGGRGRGHYHHRGGGRQ